MNASQLVTALALEIAQAADMCGTVRSARPSVPPANTTMAASASPAMPTVSEAALDLKTILALEVAILVIKPLSMETSAW